DGAVMAVTASGKKKILDLTKETPWIGALALDGSTLYVGTLGSGTIYAVDTRAGASRKLTTLGGAAPVRSLGVEGEAGGGGHRPGRQTVLDRAPERTGQARLGLG